MERADRGRDRDSRLLKNQPYDESLEVIDPEEVASVYSPAPYARQSQSRRSRPGPGLMSANSSSDDYTPQSIELEHSLKPFIPDFIPAVGDIDAFLKSNPRAVDSWVDSISALHRSKPPASVQYGRPMPDIDSLMQEWPAELEELLGRLRLPSARLGCGLGRYADLLCCLLDVPVYGSRVQSLHLLFSLYLEFRDSQHFTRRAHT
ncbi:hypothetical protein INR49_001157 [Caranx melampygus]|nr:hypothetical protein INR49_001157 [Caranx melampygus]